MRSPHGSSRRSFLKALGLGALTMPLWSLGERSAQARTGHAKYLLLFFTPGTAPWIWTPSGSSANNIAFSVMTEPLAPLKNDLILVEKLSSMGTADNHTAPGGLTGQGWTNDRTSVDQFIADKLIAQGAAAPIPSVLLGGVGSEQQSSFFKDGQVLSPIFSPTTAYDAVFGANPVGGGDEQEKAELKRRRENALALLRGELGGLDADLSGSEATKVELHLDSLQQLEDLMNQEIGGGDGCQDITAPNDADQPLLDSQIHMQLAISAFACGLTRVASVQFGHHQSTQFDLPVAGSGDWHNSVLHNIGNAEQQLIDLERWMCERFVEAADKLKSLPDPDGNGTLYDNTLMVWARDMGDAVNHNGDDMRFVFAGGAGGYLATQPNGVYIDGGGEHHQRALLNIAEAMGITNFDGFGDPAGARTPLATVGGLS